MSTFFINTRPRNTSKWRSALAFDLLRDAIQYSKEIDIDESDFIISNYKGKIHCGNTGNMQELNRKIKMLRCFIDRGGDTSSNTFNSISRGVDNMKKDLKDCNEYIVNFIIDGIKQ